MRNRSIQVTDFAIAALVILIALGLLAAFIGYCCLIVAARADRDIEQLIDEFCNAPK